VVGVGKYHHSTLRSVNGQRQLGTVVGGLVDEQEFTAVLMPKLFVRVQQLDAVDGSIGGHVHNQFVTYSNGLHVSLLFLKADIGNVIWVRL
jgi:hypothetical protein